MATKTTRKPRAEEYTITFKNEALEKLKEYARDLGIPETELGEVVTKALKLLDLSREGKLILEKFNAQFEVDPKKI